jgi:hypothetical protein
MSILLAPSIQNKLSSVTAKDHTCRPDLRRMKLLNEEVGQWLAPPLRGCFWDDDSDTEQEISQLQGTGAHPSPAPSHSPRASSTSPVPVPPLREPRRPTSTSPRKATPASSALRRVRAPLKSCWKGPLPPRWITPAAPLADFIISALHSSSSPCNPDSGSKRHPVPSRVLTPPAPVDPHPIRTATRDPRLASTQPEGARPGHPRHRLVNPKLFISPTPYRDALMAGARERFRGRHGPRRGSPADRDRTGTASGLGRGAHAQAHAAVTGHGGVASGCRFSRTWGLLPLRLTVVEAMGGSPTYDCWSRLSSSEPGVMVLMDRQARCSREGAVGAPQLT